MPKVDFNYQEKRKEKLQINKIMKTVNNDLSQKYGKGTIAIHWISALLIFCLIPTGFLMADAESGETKVLLLKVHAVVGFIVFLLTLIRSYLFFRSPRPPHLETGSAFHNKMVYVLENTFYFVIIALCISGIAGIATTNLGEIIQTNNYSLLDSFKPTAAIFGHEVLAKILIALLIAHIGGVILHYIKFKENNIKRIS